MTPNEQNERLGLNAVWNKYPCDEELMHKVVPILFTAINFCNAFASDTKERKAEKLALWVEAQYEEKVLEGFCTDKDIQAHGLALGIACRYRDTLIEPLAL